MASHHCRAFSLFEVAIALALVGASVVTFSLVFPTGLRAQRMARFQLYAGTKVLDMLDTWAQCDHAYVLRSVEAAQPWQNPFMATPVDFDRMINDGGMGLLPLPDAIASRLDSDNDEIRAILADGGRLFYTAPHPYAIGFDPRAPQAVSARTDDPPLDAQDLIWAVTGYAQQNLLPNHPCLAWPYIEMSPSPAQDYDRDTWLDHDPAAPFAWNAAERWPAHDAFQRMIDTRAGTAERHCDYIAWANTTQDPAVYQYLVDYLDRAHELVFDHLAIADDPSVPAATIPAGHRVPLGPAPLGPPPWNDGDENAFPKPWKILAMAYLANASQAMTSSLATQWNLVGRDTALDARYCQLLHEVALRWAVRYQSTDPYDWGAMRALNCQHAWQYPLIQYDLFPGATLGPLSGGAGAEAGDTTWRIAPARQPTNYGPARGLQGFATRLGDGDNIQAIIDSWGDVAHFNATARFEPSERCRQLVCWSANWLAYDDCEALPAAPIDAKQANIDSAGRQHMYRWIGLHPEFPQLWMSDPATTPASALLTGARSIEAEQTAATGGGGTPYQPGGPDADAETRTYKERRLGLHGADRNGNGRFDHGPLPASARMRAMTVGRYNFYDRRAIASLRN